MDKKQTWNILYWAAALLLLVLAQDVWQSANQVEPVPYSEFEKALADGRIVDVTISDRRITGRLKEADGRKTTLVATRVEPDMAARLEKFNVPYTRVVDNTLVRDLLSWVVPALVFVGLWFLTRGELEQKIAVLMGGRAAEKLVFGQLSIGASDDLAKATDIARAMVTRYGMDEGLGYIAFEAPRQTMLDLPTGMLPNASPVSEDTQRRIDDAIRVIVMGGFDRATAILGVNRDVLERSARALLEKETLDEAAIRSLTADLRSDSSIVRVNPPSTSS